MFKANKKDTKTTLLGLLLISDVIVVSIIFKNFEENSHSVLVFPLLTMNKVNAGWV